MDHVNTWGEAFPRPGYVQIPKEGDLEQLELARLTLTKPQRGVSQRLWVMCQIFRWQDFNEGSPMAAADKITKSYFEELARMADMLIAACHQQPNATGLEVDNDE